MKSLRLSIFGGVACALALALGSVRAQIVTTIAGTGTAGFNSDGIAATSALLSKSTGVFVYAAGNTCIPGPGEAGRALPCRLSFS